MELYNQLLLQGLNGILLRLAIVSAQDNIFISWHTPMLTSIKKSNCWVCGAMPMSVMDTRLWRVSHLRRGDIPTLCDFLCQAEQQK